MNAVRDDSADHVELTQLNACFRHAEKIGQSRLNNFLMTGTILLVGCAVALQLEKPLIGGMVSAALSILGIFFSRAWFYLGCRQQKFHFYIEACLDLYCEKKHSDGERLVTDLVRHFQSAQLPVKRLNPDALERDFSSRRMLTYVPRYFTYAYLIIFVLSVAHILRCDPKPDVLCDPVDPGIIVFLLLIGCIASLLFFTNQRVDDEREPRARFLFSRLENDNKLVDTEIDELRAFINHHGCDPIETASAQDP